MSRVFECIGCLKGIDENKHTYWAMATGALCHTCLMTCKCIVPGMNVTVTGFTELGPKAETPFRVGTYDFLRSQIMPLVPLPEAGWKDCYLPVPISYKPEEPKLNILDCSENCGAKNLMHMHFKVEEKKTKPQKQWKCSACQHTKLIPWTGMYSGHLYICGLCGVYWSSAGIKAITATQSYNPLDCKPIEDGYFCKDPNCTTCDELGRNTVVPPPTKGAIPPTKEVIKPCNCPIIGLGILHETGCIDNPIKKA